MSPHSVISIKEARKLLGKECALLSDNQVQEIINTLSHIAKEYFNNKGSNK